MHPQDPYTSNQMAEARAELVRSLLPLIQDERVLRAIGAVPREHFVPPEARQLAYADRALPIGHGQTISQPRMVAIMLQELALQGHEKVLDVGTGSGYQAALLAELAGSVVGVELIPELVGRTRANLHAAGYDAVQVHAAGDELGYSAEAPYDAIIVAAASPRVPQALTAQLKLGGRLVIPIGDEHGQDLVIVQKSEEGLVVTRKGPCGFVPLVHRDAFPSGFPGRDRAPSSDV